MPSTPAVSETPATPERKETPATPERKEAVEPSVGGDGDKTEQGEGREGEKEEE